MSECIWMSGKDAADRAWACLVLLGLGQLTPCLDRYLHLLGICSLEPSPVDRCPQLLSKNVNRVCFLVLNSSRGRQGDTSFTGEWCDQNSCSEVSFRCEEMKMFLSSLCKSCFPRKDGAWRLKPGSQEQLNGLESEHLSLAAPTRKWSQSGKALCLLPCCFQDFCQQCHNGTESHGKAESNLRFACCWPWLKGPCKLLSSCLQCPFCCEHRTK